MMTPAWKKNVNAWAALALWLSLNGAAPALQAGDAPVPDPAPRAGRMGDPQYKAFKAEFQKHFRGFLLNRGPATLASQELAAAELPMPPAFHLYHASEQACRQALERFREAIEARRLHAIRAEALEVEVCMGQLIMAREAFVEAAAAAGRPQGPEAPEPRPEGGP